MQTIFERETELGRYPLSSNYEAVLDFAEPDYALIFSQTTARFCDRSGTLKIEHQCYLRRGGNSPDRLWQEPEVMVKQMRDSRENCRHLAEARHEAYTERIMAAFPQEFSV